MHVDVDLAGASSFLRIEPGMISTLSSLKRCSASTKGKVLKNQTVTVSLPWKTFIYDLKLDL